MNESQDSYKEFKQKLIEEQKQHTNNTIQNNYLNCSIDHQDQEDLEEIKEQLKDSSEYMPAHPLQLSSPGIR